MKSQRVSNISPPRVASFINLSDQLSFTLSDEQLQQIEKRMIMEINWGLGRDTNPSSNIKSYITYVSQLPTGREAGQYLALDLGGTNFRLFLS